MSESFGTRLRHERERRQIALRSIAEGTKINIALLEGLERGDVSRWPSGIFRKAFVRSYAQSIGLDPDAVARQFVELYPDPLETPALSAEAGPAAPLASEPVPSWSSQQIQRLQPLTERVNEMRRRVFIVKLTIVPPPTSFKRGRFLEDAKQRGMAAACDAAVLCIIALGFFGVFGQFWTPLGVSMLCYYLGSVLVLGNTPGVCLLAPPAAPIEALRTEQGRLEMELDDVHVPAETFIYR